MIPKKIHWCWFGGGELPEAHKKYMETWRKYHPDYEIIEWNEKYFDIKKAPKYVQDAYEDGVYAMVSDYVRAYVLHKYGGWYLDTDVEILKPFLDNYAADFVTVVEDSRNPDDQYGFEAHFLNRLDENQRNKDDGGYVSGIAVTVSLMGAQVGCSYLEDVMDAYEHIDYYDRSVPGCLFGGPIGPQIYAKELEKYGFRYVPEAQKLENGILILGTDVMRNGEDENTQDGITCACHHCSFSWFMPYLSPKNKDDGQNTE